MLFPPWLASRGVGEGPVTDRLQAVTTGHTGRRRRVRTRACAVASDVPATGETSAKVGGPGTQESHERPAETRGSTSGVARSLALVLAVLVGSVMGSGGLWPAPAAAGDLVTVATDVLNIRSDPRIDAPVVAQAVWGDILDVWWGPSDSGYYEVVYGDVHGYALGTYLGLPGGIGGTGASGASGGGWTGNRWVDVDRSSGLVTLFEGGQATYSVWGAMGWDQSESGFYATANGSYTVFAREEGLTWTDWGRAYVTHYVAFDPYRANGFHSYALDKTGHLLSGGGNGPTGGCVAVAPWAIERIWDFATIGTRVEVHW